MSKSLTDVAKAVLMKEDAALMSTLKPGGGSAMGTEPDNKHNEAELVADAPKSAGEGSNVGAAAAGKVSKDKSKPTQGAAPAEPAGKAMMEEDEEEGNLVAESGGSPKEKKKKEEDEEAIAAFMKKKSPTIVPPKKGKDGKMKMAAEEAEINEEEDFELSEELAEFIDAMIAEGASEDEIAEAIEENFELVTEEEDMDEAVEQDPIAEALEVDMSEDIEALFSGEELSEEFKDKAKTIFEAAVKRKLEEELSVLEEAFAATLEEEVEAIQEELSSNVDDYLSYVVEQWTAENEVAIEAGLRSELTEEFISGLRNLFAEHYIDIPEDKISVVEEMASKVEELETKLNEEIDRNVQLNKMLNEAHVEGILEGACDGLTVTQAEKLKTLAEGLEYSSVEEYAQKVSTLKESYFNKPVKNENVLDSVEVSDGKTMISEESLSGPMAAYVRTLGKHLPK